MADKDPLILDFGDGRVLEGADLDEFYVSGIDDEPTGWDDIDLEDTFDLPPVLPPVRLPEEGNSLPRRGDLRCSPTSVRWPTKFAPRRCTRPP